VGKYLSAEWYGRVAVTNLDGRPVLVWSDSDGVRISDIASGDAIGRPFGPGKTSVTAGELNRRPVVAISRDATLQMWDLQSRLPISEPIYLGLGRFSGVALWANRIVLGGTYGPVCVELAVSRTLSMTGLSAHPTSAKAPESTLLCHCKYSLHIGKRHAATGGSAQLRRVDSHAIPLGARFFADVGGMRNGRRRTIQ
jgi:hypothetical protein